MAGASILEWGTNIRAWGMGNATHGSRAQNQECDLRQRKSEWMFFVIARGHYTSEWVARARKNTEQCPSRRKTKDGWTSAQIG